ncbi:exonuclease SbcCD subunit D [Tropicibacter naphthalenivorans]|uniref:Nuclease SbcCD subunit D n=1 Tax=Tropicibacter naphthalenivorans TaxID=441103 RepID=A0A0P1GGI2_9RHOB|nr:exonuclease SbcCD subunit D [Tropicibacter naphthalenivorans]CUH80915.1 Nuclease SbcCD subunit D [Tropicibacter naphthalenivorans]SMC91087.1 Exodeoxyribonuclease I subunit D [Tropicibacter naphthalenivorans]
MTLRVLHTADWHIGQTLNGWSREAEHRAWLKALEDVLEAHQIDVLLIAGDVFDGINPSGVSQKLLYQALRGFKTRRPGLVTVITAGNHDPAARLEAPAAILDSLDVHVVATVRRSEGALDVARHMVPLPDASGAVRAYACAIPFLRAADLPGLSFAENGAGSPIVEAARRFHAEMAKGALALADGLPILAMGHLHCHGATESDGAERRILIGGEHAVPEDIFPQAFDYVALGHLHRPQNLAGGRIRYSGSCFPLSATEAGYEHGVTLIEVGDEITKTHLPMPRPAPMLRLPERGTMEVSDLGAALQALDLPDVPADLRPFVYVELTATGSAAVLMTEAERLLSDAPVRPAGIRVHRPATEVTQTPAPVSLAETTPEDLFRTAFEAANGLAPEPAHIAAFRDALAEEG